MTPISIAARLDWGKEQGCSSGQPMGSPQQEGRARAQEMLLSLGHIPGKVSKPWN